MSRIRQRELHARRNRYKKLKKLREKFAAAKSTSQKGQILDKIARVAPLASKEELKETKE